MLTEEPDRSRSHADRFHSTDWENVLAARDADDPRAGAALAELCRTYWYPLYAFARQKGSTVAGLLRCSITPSTGLSGG